MRLKKVVYAIIVSATLFNVNNVSADDNSSLATILSAINKLEQKSEPKCYATASRLEDFMFGTPLNDKARFAKNLLQKDYIKQLWQKADAIAQTEKEEVVLANHIRQAEKNIFKTQKTDKGHWQLSFSKDKSVTLHKDDKRQYGSIAYSLRAVLAVQQDALLDFDNSLLPLSEKAVQALKDSLDLYTLAALKVSDNGARINNEKQITANNISTVWQQLGLEKTTRKQISKNVEYALKTPSLLNQMVEKKLNSYAAYNKVTNTVFLRNLQVYFARASWPKDAASSEAIIATYSMLLNEFSASLYAGAQSVAMENQQKLIREQDVYTFISEFIPHKINEYEDALFFPRLGQSGSVYVESYDMDAFRDAGAHWQYLKNAINQDSFKLYIEPDPFAAELMTENIAQYGVLLLREAGMLAKASPSNLLSAEHIKHASALIKDKVARHKVTPELNNSDEVIASAVETNKSAVFKQLPKGSGFAYEHRSADWLNRQLRTFLRKEEGVGTITIPPAFGGSGVAAEDVNNDGLVDVFILGGRGNKLFINQGNGQFKDQTAQYKLQWIRAQDNHPGEARQPIIADIDNDGWQDIVVTYVNDMHRVYKNIEGQYFQDVTEIANLGGKGLVGGPATVFDFDNDGDLDIYITYFGNYITGDLPTLKRDNVNGKPNQLFENKGNFKFENVTAHSGLDNTGWSQAVAHTDLNNDGWQDVIVGNDFGVNGYYINQKNGHFKEISKHIGTDKPSYTMGIGITDLNQDLLPDVYISNIVTMNKDETYVLPNQDTQMKFNAEKLAHMRVVEANDLFISQQGKIIAYEQSDKVGRGYSSTGWAWDADFFDYDLDGDDDLYVLNGMNEFNVYGSKNPYFTDQHGNQLEVLVPISEQEENIFFENVNGRLETMDNSLGLSLLSNSRSASYFDFDNDGDLDIVLNNYHESAALFENELASNNNWLKIKLIGNPSKQVTRDAIGTRIYVKLPTGKHVWREIRSTDGYMSVHPKEQHFGLGNATHVDVKVVWPNGKTQQFKQLAANKRHVFTL